MSRVRRFRAALARRNPRAPSQPSNLCITCGGEIAPGLAVLGSLACHDCRDARPVHIS